MLWCLFIRTFWKVKWNNFEKFLQTCFALFKSFHCSTLTEILLKTSQTSINFKKEALKLCLTILIYQENPKVHVRVEKSQLVCFWSYPECSILLIKNDVFWKRKKIFRVELLFNFPTSDRAPNIATFKVVQLIETTADLRNF